MHEQGKQTHAIKILQEDLMATVAPDIAAALKIIKSLERMDCWHPVL